MSYPPIPALALAWDANIRRATTPELPAAYDPQIPRAHIYIISDPAADARPVVASRCNTCTHRKKTCSREVPRCAWCAGRGTPCVYRKEWDFLGSGRRGHWLTGEDEAGKAQTHTGEGPPKKKRKLEDALELEGVYAPRATRQSTARTAAAQAGPSVQFEHSGRPSQVPAGDVSEKASAPAHLVADPGLASSTLKKRKGKEKKPVPASDSGARSRSPQQKKRRTDPPPLNVQSAESESTRQTAKQSARKSPFSSWRIVRAPKYKPSQRTAHDTHPRVWTGPRTELMSCVPTLLKSINGIVNGGREIPVLIFPDPDDRESELGKWEDDTWKGRELSFSIVRELTIKTPMSISAAPMLPPPTPRLSPVPIPAPAHIPVSAPQTPASAPEPSLPASSTPLSAPTPAPPCQRSSPAEVPRPQFALSHLRFRRYTSSSLASQGATSTSDSNRVTETAGESASSSLHFDYDRDRIPARPDLSRSYSRLTLSSSLPSSTCDIAGEAESISLLLRRERPQLPPWRILLTTRTIVATPAAPSSCPAKPRLTTHATAVTRTAPSWYSPSASISPRTPMTRPAAHFDSLPQPALNHSCSERRALSPAHPSTAASPHVTPSSLSQHAGRVDTPSRHLSSPSSLPPAAPALLPSAPLGFVPDVQLNFTYVDGETMSLPPPPSAVHPPARRFDDLKLGDDHDWAGALANRAAAAEIVGFDAYERVRSGSGTAVGVSLQELPPLRSARFPGHFRRHVLNPGARTEVSKSQGNGTGFRHTGVSGPGSSSSSVPGGGMHPTADCRPDSAVDLPVGNTPLYSREWGQERYGARGPSHIGVASASLLSAFPVTGRLHDNVAWSEADSLREEEKDRDQPEDEDGMYELDYGEDEDVHMADAKGWRHSTLDGVPEGAGIDAHHMATAISSTRTVEKPRTTPGQPPQQRTDDGDVHADVFPLGRTNAMSVSSAPRQTDPVDSALVANPHRQAPSSPSAAAPPPLASPPDITPPQPSLAELSVDLDLPPAPPEIAALLKSLELLPAQLVFARSSPLVPWILPADVGFFWAGLFRLVRVEEKTQMIPVAGNPNPKSKAQPRVVVKKTWRLVMRWVPGGEELLVDDEDEGYERWVAAIGRPWWEDGRSSSAFKATPGAASANGIVQPSNEVQPIVTASTDPAMPILPPLDPFMSTLLPLPLLAPFTAMAATSSGPSTFPPAFLCGRCGRLSPQRWLRHRWCSCQADSEERKDSWALSIVAVRDACRGALLADPEDSWNADAGVQGGMVAACAVGGRRVYRYAIENTAGGASAGTVWHLFTANMGRVQAGSNALFAEIQRQVRLEREVGGTVFEAGFDGSLIATSGADGVVPECVRSTAKLLQQAIVDCHLAAEAAEQDVAEKWTLARVDVRAWVSEGKTPGSFKATASPVAMLCLGADIDVSFPAKKDLPPTSVPARKGRKVAKNEALSVRMLHGDVLVVADSDFEYTMARTGMCIVIRAEFIVST